MPAAVPEITEAHEDYSFGEIILNCDCFTRAFNCLKFHLYPDTCRLVGCPVHTSSSWSGSIPLSAVLAIRRPHATVRNLGLKTYAAICKAFEASGIDYTDAPWWLTVPVSWRVRVCGQENAKWPN